MALLAFAIVATASLAAALWLLLARGGFWRIDRRLEPATSADPSTGEWPRVAAVIPARDEERILPATLPSVLAQDYPGPFHVFVVDDRSSDGTADAARGAALAAGFEDRLTVLRTPPLPRGWAGKVWALHHGTRAARSVHPEFLLLTDADISHDAAVVRALTQKAIREDLDLASVMATLNTQSFWERLLIPAFAYFFAMLYPPRWVAARDRGNAAAAGGCVLVRAEALDRAGGLAAIQGAIIDDCALAARVKADGREGGGRLWLGLSRTVTSVRPYPGLRSIWNLVARTAFTQLRTSPLLLIGTVLGLVLLFALPPTATTVGAVALGMGERALGGWVLAAGAAAWTLLAITYVPTLRWYGLGAVRGYGLPVAAVLYTGMTIDSAVRHWRGRGAEWKGRTY